jgi:hypothetical protein
LRAERRPPALEGLAVGQAVVFVVVGFVVLVAIVAIAVHLARLRARLGRVERASGNLSRSVATVEGWAGAELKAIRGQLTAIHVNQTADQIGERLAHKRAQPSGPPPMLEEDRPTLEMLPSYSDDTPDAPSEDEATHVAPRSARLFEEPPMYAARPAPPPRRTESMRPPAPLAPLAHPDLIGCEDIADEAARPRLGPEEKTPPRRGRAAVLVPAYRGPEEGGAA